MNKLFFLFVFTFFTSGIIAQGIEFQHVTWDEALKIAQEEEKIIFVDAYAVWCGPCKRMSKNVFTQTEVGNFYNKNFINLKLDMEKGEGLKFGKKYPVSAYPTLYYIAPDGKVVQTVRGAQNVERFLALGKKALALVDNSEQYAEAYEKGNRDPELVLKYIKALNKAGQNSLKISNEYLRNEKDLSSEGNLKILMESTVQADSYIFKLFTENRTKLEALFGKDTVNKKITSACQNTANKAVEFESRDLMEEAFDKMKKHFPEKADEFTVVNEMKYNLAFKDVKGYLKAAKKYTKTTVADNEAELSKIAINIVQNFNGDKKAMEFAEDCAKKAAEVSGKYDYDLTYAGILLENGKKEQAIEVAETALEKAKKVGRKASTRVELFLKKIKGA
jgi:thiol-disulfide isomerase/thioredoxin